MRHHHMPHIIAQNVRVGSCPIRKNVQIVESSNSDRLLLSGDVREYLVWRKKKLTKTDCHYSSGHIYLPELMGCETEYPS